MKKILLILCILPLMVYGQQPKKGEFGKQLKKTFKFSTFYAAINGGNSVSNVDVFSVTNGLETTTIKTPFDYSVALGVRKIARFGYENRANVFYDGTCITALGSVQPTIAVIQVPLSTFALGS